MSKNSYFVPNPSTPNKPVEINPELCNGCNKCVDACRTQVLMPNPEEGKPPIILYPDECWYGGCCVEPCPIPGAIEMVHPLNQRIGWKRKENGEYIRIGMKTAALIQKKNKEIFIFELQDGEMNGEKMENFVTLLLH